MSHHALSPGVNRLSCSRSFICSCQDLLLFPSTVALARSRSSLLALYLVIYFFELILGVRSGARTETLILFHRCLNLSLFPRSLLASLLLQEITYGKVNVSQKTWAPEKPYMDMSHPIQIFGTPRGDDMSAKGLEPLNPFLV